MQNFAKIHQTFLNNFAELSKTKAGKKAIKEYVDTFKKNKNLITENNLFEFIKEYSICPEEAVNIVTESINNLSLKDIKTAHKKLESIMENAKISLSYELTDGEKSLGYLIENRGKLNNEYVSNRLSLKEAITKNTKPLREAEVDDIDSFSQYIISKYNAECNSKLNENEKKIVRKLIESTEDELKTMYETEKKETLSLLENCIPETSGEIKEKMMAIQIKLLKEEYSNENVKKNIVRLLELKETLSDKE